MVEGGPIDVLTGDWLAELTMYILHKTRERSGGYARTFLRELEEGLPTCIERGITVVSNAGGLHPEGLAAAGGGRAGGRGSRGGGARAPGMTSRRSSPSCGRKERSSSISTRVSASPRTRPS